MSRRGQPTETAMDCLNAALSALGPLKQMDTPNMESLESLGISITDNTLQLPLPPSIDLVEQMLRYLPDEPKDYVHWKPPQSVVTGNPGRCYTASEWEGKFSDVSGTLPHCTSSRLSNWELVHPELPNSDDYFQSQLLLPAFEPGWELERLWFLDLHTICTLSHPICTSDDQKGVPLNSELCCLLNLLARDLLDKRRSDITITVITFTHTHIRVHQAAFLDNARPSQICIVQRMNMPIKCIVGTSSEVRDSWLHVLSWMCVLRPKDPDAEEKKKAATRALMKQMFPEAADNN